MNKFFKFWVPVIIWMVIIFTFSAIPNLKTDLKDDFILRKIVHMIEFGILTFLLCRAIVSDKSAQGRSALGGKAITFSIIIAFLYALSDEYHQTFVLSRQGTLKDVGIDSIGILITGLMWYIKSRKGRV